MLRDHAPRLLRRVLSGETRAVEPLLDLLLLPLGFHACLLGTVLCAANPLLFSAGALGLALLLFHIGTAMATGSSFRRDLKALASAPLYILWKLAKLPMTLAASARSAEWVRTER